MSVVVSLQPVDERNILHIVLLSFLSDFIFSMPSKVIVIQFRFLGINVFWVLLWAHINPRLIDFSINLLVVYRESVNLIGYITVRVDYLTNRFHVAVRLFSNRSQMTSKCGKNKKERTLCHPPEGGHVGTLSCHESRWYPMSTSWCRRSNLNSRWGHTLRKHRKSIFWLRFKP